MELYFQKIWFSQKLPQMNKIFKLKLNNKMMFT